ncbi:MAG: HAMP domain-containing protein [Candidatus Riflebacteria bacterium]|nr:HAMP domain-containing protein [Candidatus Riflebacteria bacterium]
MSSAPPSSAALATVRFVLGILLFSLPLASLVFAERYLARADLARRERHLDETAREELENLTAESGVPRWLARSGLALRRRLADLVRALGRSGVEHEVGNTPPPPPMAPENAPSAHRQGTDRREANPTSWPRAAAGTGSVAKNMAVLRRQAAREARQAFPSLTRLPLVTHWWVFAPPAAEGAGGGRSGTAPGEPAGVGAPSARPAVGPRETAAGVSAGTMVPSARPFAGDTDPPRVVPLPSPAPDPVVLVASSTPTAVSHRAVAGLFRYLVDRHLGRDERWKSDRLSPKVIAHLFGTGTPAGPLAQTQRGVPTPVLFARQPHWLLWDFAQDPGQPLTGFICLVPIGPGAEETAFRAALTRQSPAGGERTRRGFLKVSPTGAGDVLDPALRRSSRFQAWRAKLGVLRERLHDWLANGLPWNVRLGRSRVFAAGITDAPHIAVVVFPEPRLPPLPTWLVILVTGWAAVGVMILGRGLLLDHWPRLSLAGRFLLLYLGAAALPTTLFGVSALAWLRENRQAALDQLAARLQAGLAVFESGKQQLEGDYEKAFRGLCTDASFRDLVGACPPGDPRVLEAVRHHFQRLARPLPLSYIGLYDLESRKAEWFSPSPIRESLEHSCRFFRAATVSNLRVKAAAALGGEQNLPPARIAEEDKALIDAYGATMNVTAAQQMEQTRATLFRFTLGRLQAHHLHEYLAVDGVERYVLFIAWTSADTDGMVLRQSADTLALQQPEAWLTVFEATPEGLGEPVRQDRHVPVDQVEAMRGVAGLALARHGTLVRAGHGATLVAVPSNRFHNLVLTAGCGHDDIDRQETIGMALVGGGFLATLAGVLLFGALVYRRFIDPVLELKQGLERIAGGDLGGVLVTTRWDELGTLTRAFGRMRKGLQERERLTALISAQAMDAIVAGKTLQNVMQARSLHGVVLVSDIRDFTPICEGNPPDQVIDLLNRHYSAMSAVIARAGGRLYKFVGDAIMAVFEGPPGGESPAGLALAAAVAMLGHLAALNRDRQKAGEFPYRIGIGLAEGPLLAGGIGSPETRLDYAVTGPAMQRAAALEARTKAFPDCPVVFDGGVADAARRVGWEALPVDDGTGRVFRLGDLVPRPAATPGSAVIPAGGQPSDASPMLTSGSGTDHPPDHGPVPGHHPGLGLDRRSPRPALDAAGQTAPVGRSIPGPETGGPVDGRVMAQPDPGRPTTTDPGWTLPFGLPWRHLVFWAGCALVIVAWGLGIQALRLREQRLDRLAREDAAQQNQVSLDRFRRNNVWEFLQEERLDRLAWTLASDHPWSEDGVDHASLRRVALRELATLGAEGWQPTSLLLQAVDPRFPRPEAPAPEPLVLAWGVASEDIPVFKALFGNLAGHTFGGKSRYIEDLLPRLGQVLGANFSTGHLRAEGMARFRPVVRDGRPEWVYWYPLVRPHPDFPAPNLSTSAAALTAIPPQGSFQPVGILLLFVPRRLPTLDEISRLATGLDDADSALAAQVGDGPWQASPRFPLATGTLADSRLPGLPGWELATAAVTFEGVPFRLVAATPLPTMPAAFPARAGTVAGAILGAALLWLWWKTVYREAGLARHLRGQLVGGLLAAAILPLAAMFFLAEWFTVDQFRLERRRTRLDMLQEMEVAERRPLLSRLLVQSRLRYRCRRPAFLRTLRRLNRNPEDPVARADLETYMDRSVKTRTDPVLNSFPYQMIVVGREGWTYVQSLSEAPDAGRALGDVARMIGRSMLDQLEKGASGRRASPAGKGPRHSPGAPGLDGEALKTEMTLAAGLDVLRSVFGPDHLFRLTNGMGQAVYLFAQTGRMMELTEVVPDLDRPEGVVAWFYPAPESSAFDQVTRRQAGRFGLGGQLRTEVGYFVNPRFGSWFPRLRAIGRWVVAGNQPFSTRTRAGDQPLLVEARPGIRYEGHLLVGLAAEAPILDAANATRTWFLLLLVAALGAILLLAMVVADDLLEPLRMLTDGMRQVTSGHFQWRVSTARQDELGDLCRAFNRMARGLEERELMGRMVSGQARRSTGGAGGTAGSEEEAGGSRQDCLILVLGSRGFQGASEATATDQDLPGSDRDARHASFDRLARQTAVLCSVLTGAGADIDKIIGDKILAVLPLAGGSRAPGAALRQVLEGVAQAGAEGRLPLPVVVGAHAGTVIRGFLGVGSKRDFTMIGDPVNTAARIEAVAEKAGTGNAVAEKAGCPRFLLSDSARALLPSDEGVTPFGEITLKGKARPLTLFAWNPPSSPR